ncbi:MAG TPA: hypothetical protein RMG48_01390 [Myxococcales bacterium LLY-WYZ-16_1]|nr:hypothetical protein [Myxococcales bacterium LLY-WYZ-16_1]
MGDDEEAQGRLGWTLRPQDGQPRGERGPRFFPSGHGTHRTKAAAAVRAPLGIHIEHLRDQPSPRDPLPVLAAVALSFIIVLIHDRPLGRLRHLDSIPSAITPAPKPSSRMDHVVARWSIGIGSSQCR